MGILDCDHTSGIIHPDKLQKSKTQLQMDLHSLAVHQHSNKHAVEYARGEISLAEKVSFCQLPPISLPLSHKNFRQS